MIEGWEEGGVLGCGVLSVLQVGVECELKCEWKLLSGKGEGSNAPQSTYVHLPPPPTLLGGVPFLPFPSVTLPLEPFLTGKSFQIISNPDHTSLRCLLGNFGCD